MLKHDIIFDANLTLYYMYNMLCYMYLVVSRPISCSRTTPRTPQKQMVSHPEQELLLAVCFPQAKGSLAVLP
jgi:hypothetical protein